MITPCLWFDGQAEEAARFYVSLFPDSRIDAIQNSAADWPAGKAGDVVLVDFTLGGRPHQALNGGPFTEFNEAISLSVECRDQDELDRYWDGLLADGGEAIQCGWLKDRYGVRWQIVPAVLTEMMRDGDRAAARRVTEAMFGMVRLDIAALTDAFGGKEAP